MSNTISRVETSQRIEVDEIDGMTGKEVMRWIGVYVLKIAEDGLVLGLLVIKAEALGCDLSEAYRACTILPLAKALAEGVLAKEAFARLYMREDVLKFMSALPIPKQIELVEKGAVEVIEVIDGKTTRRNVRLERLTSAQLNMAFDKVGRCVRSIDQQTARLNDKSITELMKRKRITYDQNAGTIDCENLTPDEIRAYLKKHGL